MERTVWPNAHCTNSRGRFLIKSSGDGCQMLLNSSHCIWATLKPIFCLLDHLICRRYPVKLWLKIFFSLRFPSVQYKHSKSHFFARTKCVTLWEHLYAFKRKWLTLLTIRLLQFSFRSCRYPSKLCVSHYFL